MNPTDTATFEHAKHLAQSGKKKGAHAEFCSLLTLDNVNDVDLHFWIVKTAKTKEQAKESLNTIATLAPTHPRLSEARAYVQRTFRRPWYWRYPPVTILLLSIILLCVVVEIVGNHTVVTGNASDNVKAFVVRHTTNASRIEVDDDGYSLLVEITLSDVRTSNIIQNCYSIHKTIWQQLPVYHILQVFFHNQEGDQIGNCQINHPTETKIDWSNLTAIEAWDNHVYDFENSLVP